MSDFLLELRCEEIPARMQDGARAELAKLFASELAKVGLKTSNLVSYATPRRLVLMAHDLPIETQAVSEEIKGPKTSAPPQALEGFLRKTGLTQDQLVERDGVYFAIINKPGRPTSELLARVIPMLVLSFPWPKSMRWGAGSASMASLRWVRPLQGIVALLGDEIVDFTLDHLGNLEYRDGVVRGENVFTGLRSGRITMGHRFHHSGPISITNAATYAAQLRAAHVIVDQAERQAIVRDGAAKAAADAGLTLVPDEALVSENAGLTEWPVPLLGRFDEAFLEVPPEVIRLTAKLNQKYFMCEQRSHAGGMASSGASDGTLANAFVCTANIEAHDGGKAIIGGNERVLAARLSDAKFFYEQDLKTRLGEHAEKLSNIVFHEKLGTVADKVARVAKLARWLCEQGIVKGDPDLAEQAALLCKADLVTGMVGEFPELQGVMGGYYARAQGLANEVADAIRDHYKPVGQADDVPTAPVTVAVSLADKLDTIACFFVIGEKPTGSKDPFALRRAALGLLAIILSNGLRFSVGDSLQEARRNAMSQGIADTRETPVQWEIGNEFDKIVMVDLNAFIQDRLKVQQKEAGVRHDLIDAVFALGGEDDLVRLLARVKALQAFITTEDGVNLVAGYKRAANILKQNPSPLAGEGGPQGRERGDKITNPSPSAADAVPPSPARGEGRVAESALLTALDAADPQVDTALAAEDFTQAMSVLATLRQPIDAFFTDVMVNDPDPEIRAFRLGLLDRFRVAVHKVADFSKIEG